MKGETLNCFDFISGAVVVLVNAAPVLWQLVLRGLVLSARMSSWEASNPQYCKNYVHFFLERKYWGNKVVRVKVKKIKNKTRKEK